MIAFRLVRAFRPPFGRFPGRFEQTLRRKDGSEAGAKVLRLSDVPARRVEPGVSGALHDLQWVVAGDRAPPDAGRAQIVERDGLARLVALEKLRAFDPCPTEVVLQLHRQNPDRGHEKDARAVRLARHRPQQWDKLRFDGGRVARRPSSST
jgi:hypothetical protein